MTKLVYGASYAPTTRFAALDGWRGICALFVAAYHVDLDTHVYAWGVIRNAGLFVDFFFVLSGFVISHAYMKKLDSRVQVLDFALRRLARLWPLHAAILAFLIGIELLHLLAASGGATIRTAPFSGHDLANMIVPNVLLIQGLGFARSWNYPSWSISTEYYTYLLFAFFVFFAARKTTLQTYMLRALAVAFCAACLLIAGLIVVPDSHYYDIFRCIYGFFVGCAVYRAGALVLKARTATVAEGAIIVGVVIFATVGNEHYALVVAPIIFGCAVWVFAQERGVFSRMMLLPPVQYVGARSYSIYMVHATIYYVLLAHSTLGTFMRKAGLEGHYRYQGRPDVGSNVSVIAFDNRWITDTVFVFLLLLVVVVASLTYRFIETPGRRLFRYRPRAS